jgi:hypothetical protein
MSHPEQPDFLDRKRAREKEQREMIINPPVHVCVRACVRACTAFQVLVRGLPCGCPEQPGAEGPIHSSPGVLCARAQTLLHLSPHKNENTLSLLAQGVLPACLHGRWQV